MADVIYKTGGPSPNGRVQGTCTWTEHRSIKVPVLRTPYMAPNYSRNCPICRNALALFIVRRMVFKVFYRGFWSSNTHQRCCSSHIISHNMAHYEYVALPSTLAVLVPHGRPWLRHGRASTSQVVEIKVRPPVAHASPQGPRSRGAETGQRPGDVCLIYAPPFTPSQR